MKLAIITPRYPPNQVGGGEISVQLLAEHLQKQKFVKLTVYSFDGIADERVNGVSVRRLYELPQYPYTVPNEIAYRKLRRLDLEADIIHAYNMHLHPAVGQLSNKLGVPAVATLNAYPFIDWGNIGITPSLQRMLYEKTLLRLERPRLLRQMRNIALFLPLSHSIGQIYRENGLEDQQFEIIPNMIDPSFSAPNRQPPQTSQTRLLYVGYLRKSKGVQYLVHAMNYLPDSFELKIVGDGPRKHDLEKYAAESGMNDRIHLTGEVPYKEVTQAYADADIFVHPGVWPEPFGRTILEAMQAGLPVVATNRGGPAEIVPQNELLSQPRDSMDLAERIKLASARQSQIGDENLTHVQNNYHPDSIVAKFLNMYDRIMDI